MEYLVNRKLEVVEDEGGTPDAELVDADLPPGHDSEDSVEPAAGDEVDGIVAAIKMNRIMKVEETTSIIYGLYSVRWHSLQDYML